MSEYPRDYTWPVTIATYDAGPDMRLRPAGILKLQQQIGELHLSEGGLDYRTLAREGLAFLLTRTNCVVHRMPVLSEAVKIRTWHRGNRGAQFYRCYEFVDADENKLVESVTAFALVDVRSHRLLRPDAFDRFGLVTQPERQSGCPDPAKWRLPEGMAPAGECRVRWSETDWNGHLNNTVYADYLCDFLPGGMKGRRITGFSVAFVREAAEGEVLHLTARAGEGEAFVAGCHDRGTCFEGRLTWTPEPPGEEASGAAPFWAEAPGGAAL